MTGDFSRHFHMCEMGDGQSIRLTCRRHERRCSGDIRHVPEHVTPSLANVTLHPNPRRLFLHIIKRAYGIFRNEINWRIVIEMQ
ncbi:hypothetical protein BZL54_27535 [Burkholderia ubonensis subsp. mesacidophila]|uniref:Uncharacterized protein n=1 Tax=Burkholderia ubonensis subsp. mesacidophila TaxID=265293 RepID=A0A2A4F9A7_9BURK|nr:hypothetical protein BZL54_27535 [Burkholderia ubonensis subsp. mesacidophila]